MSGPFDGLARGKKRPRKSSSGTAVVLALVFAGAVVLGCGGGVVALVLSRPAAEQVKRPTREEFRSQIVGKTTDEVISLLGRPTTAGEPSGQGKEMKWYYEGGKTFDPVSQSDDRSLFLDFQGGKVVRVRF